MTVDNTTKILFRKYTKKNLTNEQRLPPKKSKKYDTRLVEERTSNLRRLKTEKRQEILFWHIM